MARRATINLDASGDSNVNGTGDTAGGDSVAAGSVADGTVSGNRIVDPASAAGATGDGDDGNATEPVRRGRGRPPGSGKGKSKPVTQVTHLDLSITDTMLFTIHMMLAERFNMEELKLAPEEAQMLAAKIAAVQNAYKVEMSPQTKAVVELAMCAGTIYGTRIAAHFIGKMGQTKNIALVAA